jgi:hypothetical protein
MHKLARLVAAVALLAGGIVTVSAAALATGAAPASAATPPCTGYNAGGRYYTIGCGQDTTDGGGGGGGGSTCFLETLAAAFGANTTISDAYPEAPPGYMWLVQVCGGLPLAINLYKLGGALTPVLLAQQAYKELSPPVPAVTTAPPAGQEGLVGLPEWFWVNAADYHPITKTVTVGGVSATVTATPGKISFNPGDGQGTVECDGPGTPYDSAEPPASQSSDCTFLYSEPSTGQPGSAFMATITVTWSATWTGTGGVGGPLGAIQRHTTIALRIAQGETVITG